MKGTKQKREALRDCDVKEIMDKLSLLEAKDRIPLAILLYTGVRRGEALGLRWENLDWKKGVIHIEQAVTFLNNQPVLGETKSDAGIRTVPFDERLMDVLRPYRQIAGFIVGDGITPMTERTFTRMWQRIDRTIDLHGATPHTFRHTYITLAASSERNGDDDLGVSLIVVSLYFYFRLLFHPQTQSQRNTLPQVRWQFFPSLQQ